ncbi:MAG: bifunctional hydroxymethylpyrimidine kinase/phosphomethylpyrimidine kinase [Nitrospiraceae bacterium]|nr:MAG: bifunctional hydroxymethylpyrimidine kinase/phosphomethylpyrimidine kinase [Nitrospiraceae bacterium]
MSEHEFKTALTIAGSDPSGGAGIQADLRVFHAFGVYGLTVMSVITAQNFRGVQAVHCLSPEIVTEQLDVLLKDIRPHAVKTGMLYSAETVLRAAAAIKRHGLGNLVVDPVTLSSTGVPLIEEEGLTAMKESLLPLALVMTPNIPEAGVLVGSSIESGEDMKEAAVAIQRLGPRSVIVTGGHLQGRAVDLLYDNGEFMFLEDERIDGEFHGTGCVFSAALTACLACGDSVKESFVRAKEFTLQAIRKAVHKGTAMGMLMF